ncbi:MAG: hypothetical protein KDK39_06995 [Leptospiraceae bacterium]|nr:hypothetical protein [Leptospiraceae bacterium]
MKKKYLYSSAVILAFFLVSLSIFVHRDRRPMQTGQLQLQIELGQIMPLMAAANAWEGVRATAKLVKDVSDAIDALLVSLESSGAFRQTQRLTLTSGNYKLLIEPSANISITPTGTGTATTYTNKFVMWQKSDDVKVLELFFDSSTDRTSGNGALAIWWPRKFDSSLQASSGKFECVTRLVSGNKAMTCSWSEGPFVSGGVTKSGQLEAAEQSSDSTIRVKSYVRLNQSSFCSDTTDYYALAFISKNASPYYTTAEFSLAGTSQLSATVLASRGYLCSLAGTNTLNYGFFNTAANPNATDSSKYFVLDASTTLPGADYPATASVDALFATMSSGYPSKGTVDSLASTPLDFKDSSTAAPGF